jgi:peroxiredoxin
MTDTIQAGERAPAFSLPAINREGSVSLADYRGRRAVMVGLFRGLHCPFCRRQIVLFGSVQPALSALGVETLAVVNTPLERARLYFRYRPVPITLLSDPHCETHRAFGIPRIEFLAEEGEPGQWPRIRPQDFAAARIDPTGELGRPTQPMEANGVLNRKDGFEMTMVDEEIIEAHGMQAAGHFLIDREGVVRWRWTEAPQSANELCRFPRAEEMLDAARQM